MTSDIENDPNNIVLSFVDRLSEEQKAEVLRRIVESRKVRSHKWFAVFDSEADPLQFVQRVRENLESQEGTIESAIATVHRVNEKGAHAAEFLAQALQREIPKLISALGPWPQTIEEALATADGLPILDARFVAYLSGVEPTMGDTLKKRLIEESAKHASVSDVFAFWAPHSDGLRPLRGLAAALWRSRVQSEFERATKKAAALPRGIYRPVSDLVAGRVDVMSAQTEIPGAERWRTRDGTKLTFEPPETQGVSPLVLAQMRDKVIERLGSTVCWRVLVHEITEGQGLANLGLSPTLSFRGAKEMCERMNVARAQWDRVREFLELQAFTRFESPSFVGNLISLEMHKGGGPGNFSRIDITPGGVLLGRHNRDAVDAKDRWLIPVYDKEPAEVGRRNEHGNILGLFISLLELFSERRRDIAEFGFVHISPEDEDRLRDVSRLTRDNTSKAFQTWVESGDLTTPSLTSKKYGVGPKHPKALSLIMRSAELASAQADRGKRSADRRKPR